jgi:licheninase
VSLRKALILATVVFAVAIAVPVLILLPGGSRSACASGCGVEDFTGTALNPAQWVSYDGYNPKSGENWQSTKCTVSGGVLHLEADSEGICGVASRTQETFANVEVRARFSAPAGAGLAPVFLFWPQDDAAWPAAGEIDWLECYDTSRQSFGSWIHYSRDGADASDSAGDAHVDMSQWHTYGVEWTAQSVRVLVDGQVWHTYLRHVPQGPMHLVFQIDRIGPVTGNATVDIDWVRHY